MPEPELALLLVAILCSHVGPSASYLMQQSDLR
jgi:hypothetical protein